jgi:hypothetical protein
MNFKSNRLFEFIREQEGVKSMKHLKGAQVWERLMKSVSNQRHVYYYNSKEQRPSSERNSTLS